MLYLMFNRTNVQHSEGANRHQDHHASIGGYLYWDFPQLVSPLHYTPHNSGILVNPTAYTVRTTMNCKQIPCSRSPQSLIIISCSKANLFQNFLKKNLISAADRQNDNVVGRAKYVK